MDYRKHPDKHKMIPDWMAKMLAERGCSVVQWWGMQLLMTPGVWEACAATVSPDELLTKPEEARLKGK